MGGYPKADEVTAGATRFDIEVMFICLFRSFLNILFLAWLVSSYGIAHQPVELL